MTKTIANKFQGTCSTCNADVAAGAGFATAELARGRKAHWTVTCRPCESGETPTPVSQDAPLGARPTFTLTDEQQAAVDLFLTGESIAIQAGAGTGKTSTLVAIAKSTSRQLTYVAFNKAIVGDASRKMPANCTCSTMSALAFHQVGKVHYAARLNNKARVTSSQIAQRIGLRPFFWTVGTEQASIQPGRLASMAYKAIATFCASDDAEPGSQHVEYIDGIDTPAEDGSRTYRINDKARAHIAPHLAAIWADLVNPAGSLPRFSLTHVEKIWQLGIHGAPKISGSAILFDEAQDANPVYLDVVRQQAKQVIFVGDSQQQIYDWRGAVNAMANVPAENTCFLTHSFRFGPEIAAVANKVLDTIESAQIRLVGRAAAGTIGAAADHDAILCRSNAGAIRTVLSLLDQGKAAHLVGGGAEVERFAKAARQLMETGSTEHQDLACFTSWSAVQEYVTHDSDGADLKLMVKLIDDFGVDAILRAVSNTTSEQDADVVVSTCHKAKGREWGIVKLGNDFKAAETDGEKRLAYVACTRAMKHLDYINCPAILDIMGETGEETNGSTPE